MISISVVQSSCFCILYCANTKCSDTELLCPLLLPLKSIQQFYFYFRIDISDSHDKFKSKPCAFWQS